MRTRARIRRLIRSTKERIAEDKRKGNHEWVKIYEDELTNLYRELYEAKEEGTDEEEFGGGGTSCTDPHWRWM